MVADPYKMLGLPHTATADQIKKSYHALARKHHPDRLKNICSSNNPQAKVIDFARIAEAYTLLNDPQRKAQYDHIYKYGGYDLKSSAAENETPSSSLPRERSSSKRSRKGVGYACNDPVFTYLFSKGHVHSTRAVAGIEIPSRFAFNQVRLAFSSGQAWNDMTSGQRIYKSQTIHYEGGQQYTRTETTILHKDGRREVILIDKDEQGRSKKKCYILNGKPIDDRDTSWYNNRWQEFKDSVLMCYGPCTAVTN